MSVPVPASVDAPELVHVTLVGPENVTDLAAYVHASAVRLGLHETGMPGVLICPKSGSVLRMTDVAGAVELHATGADRVGQLCVRILRQALADLPDVKVFWKGAKRPVLSQDFVRHFTKARPQVVGTVRPRRVSVPAEARQRNTSALPEEPQIDPIALRAAFDNSEDARPGTPERLTAWAITLSVATLSLPMALPLVAANLRHGEDLRAASLVAGLVGFYAAIDLQTASMGLL